MIFLLTQEIKNCYTDAIALNNQNLMTATIQLTSSENPQCVKFRDEVRLDLHFHDGFPTVTHIQNNYNYTSTEEIVMTNILIENTRTDGIIMPLYSKLNISNLAYWTIVRVSYIGTQLSQMDQCFDVSKSYFALFIDKFEFFLYLTNACLTEILDMSFQFQYQFGTTAETIEIIRRVHSPDDYNCEVIDGNIMRCFIERSFVTEIQTPFLNPIVDFSIKNSGIEYKTQIKFENVNVGTVQSFISTSSAQFFKDIFFIQFEFSDDPTLRETWQNRIAGADLIMYRLTVNFNEVKTTFQFSYPEFDFNRRILTQTGGSDPAGFLKKMIFVNSNSMNSEFYLDMTAFKGNVLLATTGSPATVILTCFRRVILRIKDSKNICYQIEKSPFFPNGKHCTDLRDNSLTTFTVKTMSETDVYVKSFDATTEVKFSMSDPQVCFYCPDCTDEISMIKNGGMFAALTISQDVTEIITMGVQWQRYNYGVVNIVTLIVAISIIISALADSIQKVVIFLQVSKNYKKR